MAIKESEKLINIIGPALRLLLADANSPRLVRFTESSEDTVESALTFEPATGAEERQIVEELSTAIQTAEGSVSNVLVPGLGLFSVWGETTTAGRVAGKVAVVTGAAQGFGLEIAQDLASQGACVVLADINKKGAAKAAEKLCKTFGQGRAIGLAMNVTEGESISQAIHQGVRKYGGFDLFISNAGVLKAESVKTQTEKDFDFVTAVNYKGYFLCVQKVAPVLAIQHLACADYTSDIIQINSKSGLVGSNRNGAYAGSKFGGIGLTQSFAMELIEDGIKVNSICPGNFFDGPLWSDPENGLFVQYLRTGKIPGAKTIEDVRKGYEAKVPMGRGCTTSDVMKAAYYLIDQQYETGQALPVTGGQVMLS